MDAWTEGVSRIMGWEWTDAQREILEHPTRYTLISGGVRGGKSFFTAAWVVMRVLETVENLGDKDVTGGIIPIWLVGASYDRTDREREYIEDFLTQRFGGPPFVVATSRTVGPNEITVDAGKVKVVIRTKSAADEQSLEMEAVAAIAVCEASQVQYSAYIRLLGRISERRAPILLSGTLEYDMGWYVDFLNRGQSPSVWATEDFRSWIIKSESNPFVFEGGADDPELQQRRQQLTTDLFNRIYEGVPAPPRGLVHPSFSNAIHVRIVPYVPGETVWLAIDPGIAGPAAGGSAYAVECCQFIDGQIRVFDEIFVDNMIGEAIIENVLLAPAAERWRNRPYWWATADIKGVIDRAGKARAGGNPPATEVWRKKAGLNLMWVEKAIEIPAQIDRFNSFLKVNETTGEPGIVFDVSCRGIISELGGGENPLRPGVSDQVYRWDLLPDGTIQGGKPRDRYNDAVKALSYLMVHQFGYATARGPKRNVLRVRRRWGDTTRAGMVV